MLPTSRCWSSAGEMRAQAHVEPAWPSTAYSHLLGSRVLQVHLGTLLVDREAGPEVVRHLARDVAVEVKELKLRSCGAGNRFTSTC